MGAYELLQFTDAEDLARTAAKEWLKEVSRAATQPGSYSVALSGGRIARNFFTAVCAQALANRTNFQHVHFFWSDERCVPPSDRESNFDLARESLLSIVKIPLNQIHRIRGEELPDRAAQLAEQELRKHAGKDREDQPVLDLVFLGLGEDGHVASLFPGEAQAAVKNRAVFRPVIATKPPPRRITIGYPALAVAEKVWVLASGTGKERALADSLAPGGRTSLGRVLTMRPQTKIFTDISL